MDIKESLRQSFRAPIDKDLERLEFMHKTLDSQQGVLREWQKARLALVEDVLSQFNRWLKELARLRNPLEAKKKLNQESKTYRRAGKIPVFHRSTLGIRFTMLLMRLLLLIRLPFALIFALLSFIFYQIPMSILNYLKSKAPALYYIFIILLFLGFIYSIYLLYLFY